MRPRRRVTRASALGSGLDDIVEAKREGRIKGARKVVVDGHRFDSKAEAERYRELCFLEREGIIEGLRPHPKPPILLQPGFTYRGRWVAPITYTPDFEYRDERGRRVIEDVKGFETEAFRIRWRMVQHRFKDEPVDLRLVFVGNKRKKVKRKAVRK